MLERFLASGIRSVEAVLAGAPRPPGDHVLGIEG
jgi:hypothetical protein